MACESPWYLLLITREAWMNTSGVSEPEATIGEEVCRVRCQWLDTIPGAIMCNVKKRKEASLYSFLATNALLGCTKRLFLGLFFIQFFHSWINLFSTILWSSSSSLLSILLYMHIQRIEIPFPSDPWCKTPT